MTTDDPRLQSLAGKFKWVLGIIAVILGGVVAAAYTASLAMIAVAFVATVVAVNAAPYVAQKVANLFLNLRKADARADPVTNRQRISAETWERLNATKKEIEGLDAEVQLWRQQIESLPPDERKDFEDDLRSAMHMVEEQALAWNDAETAAKEFDKVTAKVERKWKVAQTGLRIKRLSEKDKVARINELLAAEAAESADKQLATAFSSLEAIVQRGREKRALTHHPSDVIDVQANDIKQPVPLPVRRPR